MEMNHNRTDVLATNYTAEKSSNVPTKQSSIPFAFKPSPYAYVFYATTDEYACAVLVNVNRLRKRFFTRYGIHVLLSTNVSSSYVKAITLARATVTIRDSSSISETKHLLKLLAFGLHEIDRTFERIAVMDADQLILQNLDHVFDLPQADLAAPRADWIARDFISSTFMVISLSDRLWNTVKAGLKAIEPSAYDMDLINKLFADNVLVLPTSYVALNKLWYSWTTPRWYRPEEAKKHKNRDKTDEIDESVAESFWHAISIMSESNPFVEDSSAGESDERRDSPVPSALQLRR
jgi:alpha-N-acetylglucosamine transferase